jgi:WD40 repeat protein
MVREFSVHQDAITDLDLSPLGHYVATASFGAVCVTDLDTGEVVGRYEIQDVRTAAISPDGRRLVSGGAREEILMWDRVFGQRLPSLRAERAFSQRDVRRLAFLPDPRGLVTGANDGMIRLWKLPD